MAKEETIIGGSVREISAFTSGRFARTTSVSEEGLIRTITRMGPGASSSLIARQAKNVALLAFSPAPGTSLQGGALEGAASGISFRLATARASGYFFQDQTVRAVGATEEIVHSVTRMDGSVRMQVRGLRGAGQMQLSPAPGVVARIILGS